MLPTGIFGKLLSRKWVLSTSISFIWSGGSMFEIQRRMEEFFFFFFCNKLCICIVRLAIYWRVWDNSSDSSSDIPVFVMWRIHFCLGCCHLLCRLFLIFSRTLNYRKVMRVSVSYAFVVCPSTVFLTRLWTWCFLSIMISFSSKAVKVSYVSGSNYWIGRATFAHRIIQYA